MLSILKYLRLKKSTETPSNDERDVDCSTEENSQKTAAIGGLIAGGAVGTSAGLAAAGFTALATSTVPLWGFGLIICGPSCATSLFGGRLAYKRATDESLLNEDTHLLNVPKRQSMTR